MVLHLMSLEPLDRDAERVMQQWLLPAIFIAVFLFCLALAGVAMLESQWLAAGVLTAVAAVHAALADQVRNTT